MGKVKLEIKKLENLSSRQTTYSKRKNGILKKAYELSVLCDIDLLLLMFSPGGKPSFCSGKHSIEEVIARFNQLPPQERTKRKVEGLEALKKTFKKLDHDVNIQDFLDTSTPTIKDLNDEAARIQTRLAQVHERLGYWTNPDRVSDLELLMQMEDLLEKSIEQIQRQKENFQKQQRVTLESRTQLPFHLSDEQSLQHLLWTPSDHIQHVVVTQEPKLPAQREIESCTGSSSSSYFGCPSTSSKSEAYSPGPGQLSGIDNVGHDAFQGLQFDGQYQYVQHGLNMLSIDQPQGSLTYPVGTDYQPWHNFSNRIPPESPADSAFGEYLNYQKLMTVPDPSIYEGVARDASHILFDNTQHHFA